ncbi:MAG: hypothetical protein IJU48_06945 [Synergistaceae bacterium]|nr:hypothetical protein [Synergistaceae bacterium]
MTYLEIERLAEDIYNSLHATMTWENLPEPARDMIRQQVKKLLEKYEITTK